MKSMSDRALEKEQKIIADHHPEPLEKKLADEIDNILTSAHKELL